MEIDNRPAENAIRPIVIGRRKLAFSVSEVGAKANAICLRLPETVKANASTRLCQKTSQTHAQNSQLAEKISDSWPFVVLAIKVRYFIFLTYSR
ncbi:IS66 family transposase [Lysinibacillus sphaericus]|uniref:IS66 family transposase n=1 Tax=Lysinibacillus sphaericus TaxID=1421 RepID=UPI002867EA88|nr:transposase [Lysinibacillus sphaericus]